MKINFTKKQYEDLVKLVYLGTWMINAHRTDDIVEKYEEWQKRRLSVKPGITGLWQIVGRKRLPLYLNLEYDFYYIKNQSLLMDLIILWKTIPVVLFGKGAF